jgi:hypothetical protein
MRNLIWYWPELPGLPPPGQPALIRIRTGLPRAEARIPARAVLRQVLAAWSHLPPEALPLRKTTRGPVWASLLQGEPLDLSLSYEDGEAWIGLRRGGLIGVDVMGLKPVPEAAAIAESYFGPAGCAALRQSPDPQRAFALAWTQLEARCKCLKHGLKEWDGATASQPKECVTRSTVFRGSLALTVATAPWPAIRGEYRKGLPMFWP